MSSYTTRTIAFLCELRHPPRTPDVARVQRLHNRQFEQGEPVYSSFAVTPHGPVLANPSSTPGTVSQVSFLPDRIQFREELGGLTAEAFGERVRGVAQEAAALLELPVFLGQQVTIRQLVNPRAFGDARRLLREGFFGITNELEVFEREPQILGLRLVFPPDAEDPTANLLRIESYGQDPRSLYLENQGTFGPVVVAQDVAALESNVAATYSFLVDRTLRFIARFDRSQEGRESSG